MNRTTPISIVAFLAASIGSLGLARAAVPSCSSNGYMTATATGASAIVPSLDHCALNADNYFNHTTRTLSDEGTPGIDDGATSFSTLTSVSTRTFFPGVFVDLAGTDAHGHVLDLTASRIDSQAANHGHYWVSNGRSAEASADVALYPSAANGPGSGKLLVMFPGCGGSPDGYTHFMLYAAAQGYHVIGLAYFNPCTGQLSNPDYRMNLEGTTSPKTVQETPYDCQDTPASENPTTSLASYGASSSQDDCIHQKFANIVYGQPISAPYSSTGTMPYRWSCPAGSTAQDGGPDNFVTCRESDGGLATPNVTGAEFGATNLPDWNMNSVEHRLHEVLAYLNDKFPLQGWQSFCADGACDPGASWDVEWSLVTLAGHSLGTNVATYISTVHKADRVLLFSGPAQSIWKPVSSCSTTSGCNAPLGCSQEVPWGPPTMPAESKVSSENIYVFLSYFDTVAGFCSELAAAGVGVPAQWSGDSACGTLTENRGGIVGGPGAGLGLYDDTYCTGPVFGEGCASCTTGSGCANDVFNGGAMPRDPAHSSMSEHMLIDTGSPAFAGAGNPYGKSGHNFVISDALDETYAAGGPGGGPNAFYGAVWNYMLTNCVGNASCN